MSDTNDIENIRSEYSQTSLHEQQVEANPISQFEKWFDEAVEARVPEPTAMTLATAGADGSPSARIVLLKGVYADGFRFYSNYESRKGRQMAENDRVALCFFWQQLERQVRIEGHVRRLSREESARYFKERPRLSQLGAWASQQSQPAASQEALKQSLADVKQRFDGQEVPIPDYWGGYSVKPARMEFWQGRPGRLHDRIEYVREEEHWHQRRLQP